MDIEKLVSELTLEEKASLLSGADFWHTKTVERLGIPAVMVSDGPHGLRKQDEEGDHLGINDSIKAVCFPAACATAASFDRDLLRQVGEGVGDACQHEKVAVDLGPAVNIKRSPLCGRNFEYFSEDPYLAGELAAALINGIQSRNIGTSIKHFAANNQEHRRMSSDSVVDERTLREIYFPAFETAVKKAMPWTFMCSYNKLNGEYASQNHWLLTEVLRDEWGFDGLVMSDWGAVSDRVKGVHAGLDLEMPGSGGTNDKRIVDAVRDGRLSEEDVDTCVRRVLRMVDRYEKDAKPETTWDKEAQHVLAGKLAAECMVLLKNEKDVLPLGKDEKVAVIGEFAKKARYQGGGSSHINSFKTESLMDALEGCSNVTFSLGYETASALGEEPDEKLIAEAVETAKKADKVVIVAGLPDSFESEGYDRTHMRMPKSHNELIRRVAEVNPHTVVVLYNGSPVEMPWRDQVEGIIEGYLGGQAVGAATKAVLWGEVNPCGKLPETFPVHLEDNPSYLSYGGEGNTAVYTEGVFVGYRYYSRKNMKVAYPFGYGLSYTNFSFSDLKISAAEINDTDKLTVSVNVTNTGSAAGKEVVQLYVAAPESRVFRPVRELKEFAKVELQPGESKEVSFELEKRAFAYWSTADHDWVVDDGANGIEICSDSETVVLREDVTVHGTTKRTYEKLSPDTIFMDLKDHPQAMEKLAPMLQQIMSIFGGGAKDEETTDAAKEAISDEMGNAMLQYMPLRGIASFSGGAITYDQLAEMTADLNKLEE